MDNEEIQGVKFSEFPSATPGNSDEVVGLHSGGNARFTIANIVAAVRNGLANIFVPKTDVGAVNGVASLDNTGKVPSSQLPSSTGPEPATATPLMDGTGAVGVSTKYAREDHEHPADTNKQNKITANGILKGDGAGGVSAAVAGTDYATPGQLADKAAKADLTSIQATGTTNITGAAIPAGAYFYLNGVFCRAKTQIDVNATFTVNTNYEQVTVGDSLYHVESTMKHIPLPSNGSVKLEFSGYYVALLTIRGAQRDSRTITLISGYGTGSLRNNIDSIYNGWGSIAISINEDSIGVTITSTAINALTINLLILQGKLVAPTT